MTTEQRLTNISILSRAIGKTSTMQHNAFNNSRFICEWAEAIVILAVMSDKFLDDNQDTIKEIVKRATEFTLQKTQ